MVGLQGLVEAASGAVVASVTVAEASRRYWTRREARQQVAFRAAVQQIVDEAMAPVLARQVDTERRQGKHLDRQDTAIAQIRADIAMLRGKA